MVSLRWSAALLALAFGAGCDGAVTSSTKTPADFDRPVAASVKRAELRVVVALPPERDCEERFDLALYADRGVDLVQWDDEEGCAGRVIVVRYFPERIDEATLRAKIRELAQSIESPPDAP